VPAANIESCTPGSLVLIPNFRFSHTDIRPKYCITLECWNNAHDDIIAVLTTSNMEHRQWKGAVFVPKNTVGLPSDSLIMCHNPKLLRKYYFSKARYINQIPQEILGQVLNNLKIGHIDPFLVLRVRGITQFP
jgi:mRNA-degrading endonuclease toxin of MazEF toxin-antitoxin module